MKNTNNLGIVDNQKPNSSNSSSNLNLKKLFGKAEVSTSVNDYIFKMFSKDEKVFKSFSFLTDDIVLTNYGIYHHDRKLIGKSINVTFLNFTNIAGIEYSRGGSLSTSGYIKILYKFNISDLIIKISKKDDLIVNELINIIKNNYLFKIENQPIVKNISRENISQTNNDNLQKDTSEINKNNRVEDIEEFLIEEED